MLRAETILALLLRAEAVLLLTAVAAVFLPSAWMAAIHAALGMGALPQGPIVEYLTRSLSGLYACWGLLYFVLAADVYRYLFLIRFLAVVQVVCGLGLLVLNFWAGMPLLWCLLEGPTILVLSTATLLLARRVGQKKT